jgi:hypothetical protein
MKQVACSLEINKVAFKKMPSNPGCVVVNRVVMSPKWLPLAYGDGSGQERGGGHGEGKGL